MKKSFILLIALCLPFIVFSQIMDTTTTFYEDFDGTVLQVSPSTSPSFGGAAGDWQLSTTLYQTAPKSYHTPVYNTAGMSQMFTSAIPVSYPGMNVNHVYLSFDHICKVNQLDEAYIYYALATGVDADGNYIYGGWKKLNFQTSDAFYFGDGAGTKGTYSSGKFNDAAYSTWNSSSTSATPTNAWWKHEYFDITDLILNSTTQGVTHFRMRFHVNKSSPSSSGTQACAGWYVDNIRVILSNCELELPVITLTAPIYENTNNNMKNNIGPYVVHATITDNDTLNMNTLEFTYRLNDGPVVTVPNTINTNVLNANGHTVTAQWNLPTMCYYDTIRYTIAVNDVHGSHAQKQTQMIAWHNQTNIQNNDCSLDSINSGSFPHCFITGVAQPVTAYFKNKSDAVHSQATGSAYQTAVNFTFKVENANHVVTHNSTHNWTGSLCFDERDNLPLGTFTPTHGFNYITVYVNSRNGQTDGYHTNDTIRFTGFACDSLLHGDYTVGGTNPDFVDMEEVKASLQYCGIDGPTTFHLRPGTYQDFDFTENYIGQSATNTITFQGDNSSTVIVTNNHTDAGTNLFGAVTLVSVNNFKFKNLTIQGNNNATTRGVVLRGNGCRNILFENCKINTFATNSTATTTSFGAGRTVAATTVPDTVVFRNCNFSGANFGVYYIGSTTRRNQLTIENCHISSCYRGIQTSYCNTLIQNNHVIQYPANTHQNFTGIYTDYTVGADVNNNIVDSVYDAEYGIYFKNATLSDFYLRNNKVKVGNSNFGVYVGNSSSTTTMTGHIYNNEIILYPVTAAASYAMKIETCNNLQVNNNSMFVKSDAPYNNTAALMIQNNNNTNFNNNILVNLCNTSDNTNFPLYLNNTSTITGTYNDFYSASGIVAFKTVSRNSIDEFENAVTTTSHNVSLLPPMADPTDNLMPADYTGLECGRNVNVLTDIRGTSRTELTYMGAYANQIAATDASIVALVSPASGTCPQNSYNITVKIANKGSETLNFAAHNAVVTVHSDSLNLNQTVNVTSGSAPILGFVDKVVANNVAIPVNQVIDFTFIIRTNGDANYLNDTLRTSFVLEAAIPDYDEDFSNGTKQTWTIEQLSGAGNWSFQEGAGVNPAIAPVYGTGRLFFNSKTFANQTQSRAIMPVVQLANSVNPILEFWFAHDNTQNKTLEGVTVKVSTDGGNTFNSINPEGATTALIKRYKQTATTPEWTLYTYDLSSYVSSGCIYIAFDAYSQLGNNINIDRIRLRNLYDNDVAVTNIYTQGETPAQYGMRNVVSALVRNEGRQAQNNVKVYLDVIGATEQYHDSLTVSSIAYNQQQIVTFADHLYNVEEVKSVQVRSRNDQNNSNNAAETRMVTTHDVANYADTTAVGLRTGDYNAVIRPCVRYKTAEELVVTAVKYYYDQTYIANPNNGMKAFVSNSDGEIVATSELVQFSQLQQGWNIIPIVNFAITNMQNEFYVGIEMLSNGDYLCSQIETPLRDSTFYYLSNGTYTPQTFGRFMIGALVDTPHVHDLAILSLQNPTSRCDLGHEAITVEITNNGSTVIPAGTIMNYQVNNLPVVSEPIQEAIQSHETSSFAFNTIFDFTNNVIDVDSLYTVRVWATKLAQDRLQFNDTVFSYINSIGKSALPIVPDTVNISYHTSGTITAQLPPTIPQGEIGWFTNTGYESWNLLGYTNNFTTPVIYFDTTFYANANPGFIYEHAVGTETSLNTQPFMYTSGYSRGRMLYTSDEIGSYGTITSIGVYVGTAATGTNGIPMRLYMKETDLSTLPTGNAAVDWNSEIADATLVVDDNVFFSATGWYYFNLSTPFDFNTGNLMIYTETTCADHCTGTGNQCNNCGAYVSGTTGYPKFRQSTAAGRCQYKNANTIDLMNSGTYTAYNKRLNMDFKIANLECGSEKVAVYVHVPDVPTFDVETQSLEYPTGGCTMLDDEHIQVNIKNLLNTSIPANKVVVHARFNNNTASHTIDEPFAPEELKTVTFTAPIDLSAPTANVTYNYVIYTTMNNEAIVYRANDTITGTLASTRTAPLQDEYNYTGAYTQTYTILAPADRRSDITQYYFYNNQDDATPFHTTTTQAPYYTTPVLYDSVTYWVAGKTQTSNCTTRRVPVHVNVFTPQYDLITDSLMVPTNYQCGLSNSPQIQVRVGNTAPTTNTIPAGTFQLNANFTGTNNRSGNTTISTPISNGQFTNVGFTINNLASTTQNNSYNYTIYSNPVNASMGVYRGNDTISGQLFVPANPTTPTTLNLTAPYGTEYNIHPNSSVLDYYYFYDSNAANAQPIGQGTSYTTEPVYGNTTYYYSGRIEDADFMTTLQVGTGTVNNAAPLNTTYGHSYAKMLYSKSEMGGSRATIDTLFVNVLTANNSGVAFPVKIWLKNTADATNLTAATVNWPNETNSATLAFDGDLEFGTTGWLAIPVNGGFAYTGEGLLMYVEHNCGSTSCVTGLGIVEPKFQNTQYTTATTKKTLQKYQNTAVTSAAFTLVNYRWNTKFKMNYSCPSPKGIINISTSIPTNDIGVIAVTAPVTPNNAYTAAENVTVTLKNFGSQTASNFPVAYQLDNNGVVTQNYTGSIAAGQTANMTFTTPVDLSGIYYATPFRAYTNLTSDGFHGNDTTTILVSKVDPCVSRPRPSVTNDNMDIVNVTFAGINNGTAAPFLSHPLVGDGKYADYTQTVPAGEIIVGQTYPISISHAMTSATASGSVYKTVYIDYNRNGEFETTEKIFTSSPNTNTAANATYSTNVDIPTDATLGLTRMRVICVASNFTNACETYNYAGETEDYAVVISQALPNDLGIAGYVHPVGNVCPDTNAKVRVIVKNYGSQTQSFTGPNSVTLTTVVSGAATGTYTTQLSSGSLAPGEETTMVIDNVNISAMGNYTFSSTLSYNGDQYAANDTMSQTASTTQLSTVLSLPVTDDFDQNTGTDVLHFNDAYWLAVGGSAPTSYKWEVNQGSSPNNATNGGPVHDHTYASNPSLTQFGRYATVAGINNGSASTLARFTTLTSKCINLHYRNGYPVEVGFYKFFYGPNNSNFQMEVRVGSGSNFVTKDVLTKADGGQSSINDPWVEHVTALTDYDEVGQLQFYMTQQAYRIDPSIDDISIKNGLPDLAVEGIDYPYDFRDPEQEGNCLLVGDTVHPVVVLKNNGHSPVLEYDVMCIRAIGSIVDTLTEHVTERIDPGQSYTYTMTGGFEVPQTVYYCQFSFYVIAELDKDETNNTKRVISCTSLDIDPYETVQGITLNQNVPNPAVNSTLISYQVPDYDKATLKIYSNIGQLLYTESQESNAGDNTFTIDTKNLADGIYFYSLTFKDVTLTKKMIIQR